MITVKISDREGVILEEQFNSNDECLAFLETYQAKRVEVIEKEAGYPRKPIRYLFTDLFPNKKLLHTRHIDELYQQRIRPASENKHIVVEFKDTTDYKFNDIL